MLGSQFDALLALPEGRERQDKGRGIMAACEKLFQRDRQPAYLWNALDVACRSPLPAAEEAFTDIWA